MPADRLFACAHGAVRRHEFDTRATRRKSDGVQDAVIRLKQRERLYVTSDYGVAFIGRSLFRSTISLPPNVPVGPLTARLYLFKDGQLLGQYKSLVKLERTALNALCTIPPMSGRCSMASRPFCWRRSRASGSVRIPARTHLAARFSQSSRKRRGATG